MCLHQSPRANRKLATRYFGSAARESHSTCDAHKSDCYNKPRWASNYRQESKVRQLFQLGCPHMRQLFQLGCPHLRQLFQLGCPHLRQLFQLGCPHLRQLFQLGCSIRTNVIILVILELIPYFFQTSREGDRRKIVPTKTSRGEIEPTSRATATKSPACSGTAPSC